MNGRPLTDERIAAVLRGIAPASAQPGLAGRISSAVQATSQQRRLPWFLGVVSGAGPMTGRRNLLVATAFLLALALATTAVIAVLRQRQDDPIPTRRGLLAYVQEGDLYLAAPDGSGAMLAAHVDGTGLADPRWSPDGRWVAVRTDEPVVLALDSQTLEMRRIGPGTVSSWSPDGKRLVVMTQAREMSIVDIETGAAQVVPPQVGDGFDWSASWSPDGRWLAVGSCCGGSNLLRIDAGTGDVITLDPIESRWGFDSAWSPDSTRLAFIQKHELRGEAATPMVVIDADGTNRIEVVEAEEAPGPPHWSPDGAWIAYHAPLRGSLMIVRPDGTDRRQLAWLTGSIVGWAPDGTSIAVTLSSIDPPSGINEVSVADGSTRKVIAPSVASGFTWATLPASDPAPVPPTGAVETASPSDEVPGPPRHRDLDAPGATGALAFDTRYGLPSGGDACRTFLFRFPDLLTSVPHPPKGGSCPDRPNADGSFSLSQMLWSPDGTAVARVASSETGTLEVFGLDGTARSGMIPIGLGVVAWSPDGTWLAAPGCPATEGCPAGWFLVRPDGSDVRRLPGQPAWSADGQRLSVVTSDGHLLLGRPDGTDLIDIGAFPMPESWSPNGRQFAFIRDGNVWIANADGSDARNLSKFGLGGVTDAWWSPGGRWIAVLRGDTLLVIDPVSGDQRRLGSGFRDESLTWSPDGSSLAAFGPDAEVVLFDASAWHPTRLYSIRSVAWSPDGRYLAGVPRTYSPEAVEIMNADGSGRTSLWQGPDGSGAYVNSLLWVP